MSVIRTTALLGQLHNMCNTQRELIHFNLRVPEESGRIKTQLSTYYTKQYTTCNSVKNKRNIDAAGKCETHFIAAFLPV